MRRFVRIRHLCGAFFLAVSAGLGGTGQGALMMVPLVVSAICFSEALSEWAAAPFVRFIDCVYFGSNHIDPPPASYKLARFYGRQRQYDDAMAEYERILSWHPRDTTAWSELIATARQAGDAGLVDSYYLKARRRLRGKDRLIAESAFSGRGS